MSTAPSSLFIWEGDAAADMLLRAPEHVLFQLPEVAKICTAELIPAGVLLAALQSGQLIARGAVVGERATEITIDAKQLLHWIALLEVAYPRRERRKPKGFDRGWRQFVSQTAKGLKKSRREGE